MFALRAAAATRDFDYPSCSDRWRCWAATDSGGVSDAWEDKRPNSIKVISCENGRRVLWQSPKGMYNGEAESMRRYPVGGVDVRALEGEIDSIRLFIGDCLDKHGNKSFDCYYKHWGA